MARQDLAPRALDAYPEAYSEFQKTMLLLLSVGNKHKSDEEAGPDLLAEELASGAREELAATLVTTLRQRMEAYDPDLSLLLRYLPSLAVHPNHQVVPLLLSLKYGEILGRNKQAQQMRLVKVKQLAGSSLGANPTLRSFAFDCSTYVR